MANIAVYAGTFAPITLGHLDIIQQAATLFDQLIIAVSPYKRDDLALTQMIRVELVRQSVTHLTNVTVIELEGSLVSFAKQHKAQWLVRGLRNANDLAIEQSMAAMNQQLSPNLQTVFLQADLQHQHIQATLVRQLMLCKEDISAFVPAAVLEWYLQ